MNHKEKVQEQNIIIMFGGFECNENLNQTIAKKVPKSQHYSGSESLAYRLSAWVAHRNKGEGQSAFWTSTRGTYS